MTIRISSDFSSLIVVDDDQTSYVVPLDPAKDTNPDDAAVVNPRSLAEEHPDWLYPAFVADPGFQLFTQSRSSYDFSMCQLQREARLS
jgi:hypothetical protein